MKQLYVHQPLHFLLVQEVTSFDTIESLKDFYYPGIELIARVDVQKTTSRIMLVVTSTGSVLQGNTVGYVSGEKKRTPIRVVVTRISRHFYWSVLCLSVLQIEDV